MKEQKWKLRLLVPATARPFILQARESIRPFCFCILGLLNNKQKLPASYVVKVYNKRFKRGNGESATPYKVNEAFQFLRNSGLIEIKRFYYDEEKTHYIYKFTDPYINLREGCKCFYRTYRDMYKYQNAIDISNQSISPIIPQYETSIPDYNQIWTISSSHDHFETNFITNLSKMSNKCLRYDYQAALNYSTNNSLTAFPTYVPSGNFKVYYQPTKTGRLTPNPHIHFKKEFRQFLMPAEDPNLTKGSMFSLDYSAQELRVLGHYCDDGKLKQICNKQNAWRDVLKIIDVTELDTRIPQQIHKHIMKDIVYGILYGSNGSGPTKSVFEHLVDVDIYLTYEDISKFIMDSTQKIYHYFPEINNFWNRLKDKYKSSPDTFKLPGDLPFEWGYTDPKPGKKPRHKPLKSCLMNNYIQATGSFILRNVIANSDQLETCRILYPVHDACVFYVPDKMDHDTAVSEATSLMEDSARKVTPSVIMPVKLEWERLR